MAILIYLLKVNLILGCFYGFYWILLRKNTFFQTNRLFLISSVFVAFLMPLLRIKHNSPTTYHLLPTLNEISLKPIFSNLNQFIFETEKGLPISWFDILTMIYWAGVGYFGLRFLYSIIRVFVMLHRSEPLDFVETYAGKEYWLLKNVHPNSSFSFFNFLVMNDYDLKQNQGIIREHEEVHINQSHSWDIILLEIVHVFCWFNPIVYFLKKSIKLLHEYFADQFVNELQPAEYAQFLFAYNFRTNLSQLSNDFFRNSLLKERIKMLVKKRSNQITQLRYLAIIPLFLMIFYFMCTQNIDKL